MDKKSMDDTENDINNVGKTETLLDKIKAKATEEEWGDLLVLLATPHKTDENGIADYNAETYHLIETKIDLLIKKYNISQIIEVQ